MGKYTNMILYYKKVNYCSCLEPGTSSELQNIIQKIVALQKVLPVDYRIAEEETRHFVSIFRAYRNELLAKYIKSNYMFSTAYSARMWRKYFHVDKLKTFFGGFTQENLFFTQILYDFFQLYLSDRKNSRILFTLIQRC